MTEDGHSEFELVQLWAAADEMTQQILLLFDFSQAVAASLVAVLAAAPVK